IEKIRPLIFSPGSQSYHGIGEFIGKAFKVGKKAQ
ncbi:MAG: flavin reductase family protein, partial [Desulfobulbus sp.]